jgi:hypothetical protein
LAFLMFFFLLLFSPLSLTFLYFLSSNLHILAL